MLIYNTPTHPGVDELNSGVIKMPIDLDVLENMYDSTGSRL